MDLNYEPTVQTVNGLWCKHIGPLGMFLTLPRAHSLYRASKSSNVVTTELPTSTFLPYFVRFLKENTAVCFYLIKYGF